MQHERSSNLFVRPPFHRHLAGASSARAIHTGTIGRSHCAIASHAVENVEYRERARSPTPTEAKPPTSRANTESTDIELNKATDIVPDRATEIGLDKATNVERDEAAGRTMR